MTLDIYVPTFHSRALLSILPKSGIVGRPVETESLAAKTSIYYEGNKFNYSNVKTWADKVRVAAHRQNENYPTIARSLVPSSELRKVGYVEFGASVEVVVTDRETLSLWLGEPKDLDAELRFSTN